MSKYKVGITQINLETLSKEPNTQYAVRFSHRENESYLIFFPT